MQVVPLGDPDPRLIDVVARALSRELRTPCSVSEAALDIAFSRHPDRNQYHSSEILARLAGDEILIGVTDVDLYIPILTFVFGEAQLGGRAAVVSYHRLTQEFYGLPSDDVLLAERLIKEAIHETGHVLGLVHCDDYECVMASSHAVERLDLKSASFCDECRNTLL